LGQILAGKYAAFERRTNSHPDPRTADAYNQDLDVFADKKGLAGAA
jgi:hypothetical protein